MEEEGFGAAAGDTDMETASRCLELLGTVSENLSEQSRRV